MPRPSGTDCIPAIHRWLLAAATILYVSAYGFTSAIPDTTRDMYVATEISRLQAFPAEGPILGGAVHFGPIWFYLLAIPLIFLKSWLGAQLFIGMVAGTKFILAYECGRRLLDNRLGLLWAALLLIPGWTGVEQLTVFNPNIAEACVLLVLLLSLSSIERFSLAKSVAIGFTSAVALHSHPTTILALPLSAIACTYYCPASRRSRVLPSMLLGFMLPFLPYMVSQISHGLPDLHSAQTYTSSKIAISRVLQIPRLWYAFAIEGPDQILQSLLNLGPRTSDALRVLVLATYGTIAVFLIRSIIKRSRRVLIGAAATGTLLFACVVLVFRDVTPYYFVYALTPLAYGLTALGLHELSTALRFRWLPEAAFACFLILQLMIFGHILAAMQRGLGTLPDFGDIAAAPARTPYTDIWFPAYAHDEMGRVLCSYGKALTLHGAAAYVADRNLDVDAFIACDHGSNVQLSGNSNTGRIPVVGMPMAFWRAIDRSPQCVIGSLGFAEASVVVWPPHEIPKASARKYYPRAFATGVRQRRIIEFSTDVDMAIVVTNVIYGYADWLPPNIKVNGGSMEATERTLMSSVYLGRDAAPSTLLNWTIELDAQDLDKVDVVGLRPSSRSVESISCTQWIRSKTEVR